MIMPLNASIATSATPLRALTAVVLDTETTSLDPRVARIVELGAVAVVNGSLDEACNFATLVKPDIQLPAAATAIHGITDAMTGAAPEFAAAFAGYAAFAGRHLVLGYALGFDLAVLAEEHRRAGLVWTPPRALDVRDLAGLVAGGLPDNSLETVAAGLGIAIDGRHRALADAKLTARVFLALLPRLRAAGIRTLAEAEAACRQRAAPAAPGNVGWHDVAAEAGPDRQAVAALARVDSYPYRHRVSDVMSAPAKTIAAAATLREALGRMMAERISSLVVEPADPGKAFGIITERDILRAIDRNPQTALALAAGSVASAPLETVAPEDFLFRAVGRMRRKRFRHLGVADAAGRPVGVLTQRDLLRQRADEAIALTDALDEAADVASLAAVWHKLAGAARALLAEEVDPRDIAAIISGEVCNLTAHAAAIATRELCVEGRPPPDVRYAVMVLGSGGRGESLLAMDQDNAIVFDPGETGGSADLWLKAMATRMNAILDEVGLPFCKGGVMARNDPWRRNLSGWRRQVSSWLSHTEPAAILNADIFFDALPVHGDRDLAETLHGEALAAAAASTPFIKLMSLAAAEADAPLGWFGRFRLDGDGRMDLKRGGIMPIFSAARILAIRHGIAERATPARLAALRGKTDIPARLADAAIEAHKTIMTAILHQQLADIERGIPPSSHVDPAALPAALRDRLKWALRQVASVRDLLGDPLQ